MYIQYTGYTAVMNSRIYMFHVLDASRKPREFTVRINSDTNHWNKLKLQDGPSICFERLEQELGRETPVAGAPLDLCISEEDIRNYLARHYPQEKVHGHKDSPDQPAGDSAMAPPNVPADVFPLKHEGVVRT